MKYCFGDIVVVEHDQIGVIVKSWLPGNKSKEVKHEVYVRNVWGIKEYPESEIERYMVRHKELDEQELEWQNNAINNHCFE